MRCFGHGQTGVLYVATTAPSRYQTSRYVLNHRVPLRSSDAPPRRGHRLALWSIPRRRTACWLSACCPPAGPRRYAGCAYCCISRSPRSRPVSPPPPTLFLGSRLLLRILTHLLSPRLFRPACNVTQAALCVRSHSRNAEESDFTSHAQGVASSVVFSFVSGLNRTRAAGETLAGAFSSPAPSGRPWPNVSLPTFLAAASPLLLAADSRRVAFEPVFAPALLPGWLSFAATAAQPGVPVAGGLTHIGASSLVPYNATGIALVVPIFQVAPASLASQALFDQYSEPRRVAAITQALARNTSVVTDFVVLLSELSSPNPQPSGLLFSPLTDGGAIVAFIMVGFSWCGQFVVTSPARLVSRCRALVASPLAARRDCAAQPTSERFGV